MPRRGPVLLGLPTLGRAGRSAALALAAFLAVALIGVPPAAEVRAQGLVENPHITVDPVCMNIGNDDVGGNINITVRGYSFPAGMTVALRFGGVAVGPPGDAIPASPFGTFESTVTVFQGNSPFSYLVEAFDASVAARFPIATTYFDSPCPAPLPVITITPDCGEPGTTVGIHVDGRGFVAGFPIKARIVDAQSEENIYAEVPPAELDPNAVSLDIQFAIPAAGVYRVVVDQVVTGEIFDVSPFTAVAWFVAPCSQLVVTPSCGREGGPPDRYTLLLSGTGFIPGVQVEFIFDPAGVRQRFYSDFSIGADGSLAPVEINPYLRGAGQYEVLVRQAGETGVLHETRAIFTVPCAPATVTLDPPCAAPQFVGDEPRSFALNVQGFGFEPGAPIIVTFDPDGLSGPSYTSETAEGVAGPDGSFSVPMTIAARPANTYRISVQQQVGTTIVEGIVPPFTVPCAPSSPTINVRPRCDREAPGEAQAYSIRVVGRQFIPGFVEVIFDADGTPETFPAFADAAQGRFETTIRPSGRATGTYRIVAQQRDINVTLSLASFDVFKVSCDAADVPVLTVTPDEASPGFVVQVRGQGFPAGSTISLSWSQGIGASVPTEVVVGADGTFNRQVLIFAHDFIGAREMTAGTPDDPLAFADARDSLLVTPGQGSPSAYTILGSGPLDAGPIIIRR